MSKGGRKWCEDCKVNVPYTRAAIVDHENSARHKQNHQRALNEAQRQARKKNTQNGHFNALSTLPQNTQNNSKPTRSQQTNKQKQPQPLLTNIDEDQEYFDKWAKKPYEEKQGQDINDTHNYIQGKIWILEEEEDTHKLRFRNTLTGQLSYKKPFGLNIEDYEQQAWDQYQQKVDAGLIIDKNQIVKLGEWEEVKPEDNFLEKYKASDSSSQLDQAQKSQDIEDLIITGKIQKQQDLLRAILMENHTDNFNQKLRDLAEKDIDLSLALPQLPTIQNKHQEINADSTGLFKKRKMNQGTSINLDT